jgi:hypothetical protein
VFLINAFQLRFYLTHVGLEVLGVETTRYSMNSLFWRRSCSPSSGGGRGGSGATGALPSPRNWPSRSRRRS